MNKSIKKGFIGLLLMSVVLSGCQKTQAPAESNQSGTDVQDKVTGSREEIAKAYVETLGAGDFDKLLQGFAYDSLYKRECLFL